jgi:hypothetical protein
VDTLVYRGCDLLEFVGDRIRLKDEHRKCWDHEERRELITNGAEPTGAT